MGHAILRFYEELNDLLPVSRRKTSFPCPFEAGSSVADLLDRMGVPPAQVDLVLVDGRSVDLSYEVQDQDRISVYPVFEAFDITPLSRIRSRPLRNPRFAAEGVLRPLAQCLRLLGFDVLHEADYDAVACARLAAEDRGRIVLARRAPASAWDSVTHSLRVGESHPLRQTNEVLARLDLFRAVRPFTRCIRCNGLLRVGTVPRVCDQLGPHMGSHAVFCRVCSASRR